jgi:hypothetical protein
MDIPLRGKFGSGNVEVGSGKSEVGLETKDPSSPFGSDAASKGHKEEFGLRNKNGEDSALNSAFRIPSSDFNGVPIIAMTAHAMAGDDQKSIEAGMNDHVTKPIDPDKLFATLQKWIKPLAERGSRQMVPMLDTPWIRSGGFG